MRQSKKGFGLAEVIISFAIMVILMGVMATSIQLSQKLIQHAETMRNRTSTVALACAKEEYVDELEKNLDLEFSYGSINFKIPVSVQKREVILSETETLTFRVFAER